jgi:nickel-dependent lactate racemase
MEFTIPYGKHREQVKVSDRYRIYVCNETANAPSIVASPEAAIIQSLRNPVNSDPLAQLSKGKKNVVVLVSDHTRPTPSGMIVQQLLLEMASGGVKPEQVTVLFAGGLHEPTSEEKRRAILGDGLFSQVKTAVHDPDDKDNLTHLGETSRGTPIILNSLAVQADLLISLSVIEPHLLYGWSGGAKNVLPGISAREVVYKHHKRIYSQPAGLDIIDNNIHRADAEETARKLGLDFICNMVLNRKRQPLGVFSGDCVSAHRAGLGFARKFTVSSVPEYVDIVISALGGEPRDVDFWQAEGKGLMHAQHLAKDNGVFILAAGCRNGVGGEAFASLIQKRPEEIKQLASEKDYTVPLMKAFDLVKLTERCKVILVCPGLSKNDMPHLKVSFLNTVKEAADTALDYFPSPETTLLAVPDASRMVIKVDEGIGRTG